MPHCSVCAHPSADAISRALALNTDTISGLADHYNVSRQALYRHKEHLPAQLAEEAAAGQLERVPALIAELQGMKGMVGKLIQAMRDSGDFRGAAGAVREATRLLELIAKISGDLVPAPAVQVNVVQSVEFQTVAARIVAVLAEFPEARQRVVSALEAMPR